MAHTVQRLPGGDLSVPMISIGDPLKKVLQRANLHDHIRRGLEAISDKLARERKGIDHLLQLHGSRILGCMLDMDSSSLGSLITGKERQIKAIMAEHKGVVAEILRTLFASQ